MEKLVLIFCNVLFVCMMVFLKMGWVVMSLWFMVCYWVFCFVKINVNLGVLFEVWVGIIL